MLSDAIPRRMSSAASLMTVKATGGSHVRLTCANVAKPHSSDSRPGGMSAAMKDVIAGPSHPKASPVGTARASAKIRSWGPRKNQAKAKMRSTHQPRPTRSVGRGPARFEHALKRRAPGRPERAVKAAKIATCALRTASCCVRYVTARLGKATVGAATSACTSNSLCRPGLVTLKSPSVPHSWSAPATQSDWCAPRECFAGRGRKVRHALKSMGPHTPTETTWERCDVATSPRPRAEAINTIVPRKQSCPSSIQKRMDATTPKRSESEATISRR
mmetsp:Transcript_20994/g.65999  ORF Transcript_20994/g.65999 Transcript_20994/m.65999 type:complete len:274 (+) Transcript_20994:434-1255(+)